MKTNKYLYETKPQRVKAIQFRGDNEMEVNEFVSWYGKHDIYPCDYGLLICFSCLESYTLGKGDYLMDDGNGLRVEGRGLFESKYRKVK